MVDFWKMSVEGRLEGKRPRGRKRIMMLCSIKGREPYQRMRQRTQDRTMMEWLPDMKLAEQQYTTERGGGGGRGEREVSVCGHCNWHGRGGQGHSTFWSKNIQSKIERERGKPMKLLYINAKWPPNCASVYKTSYICDVKEWFLSS